MTSGAGNISDSDAICARLESHAVVVVADVNVLNSHVRAGADVETVCVLRLIFTFRRGVHLQITEKHFVTVALDRIKDVGWVLLTEI